ncbi:MAG: amino acid permease [Blastocatellia bacterium]|nr:amino acid permease [Blastocatellia bacterium]
MNFAQLFRKKSIAQIQRDAASGFSDGEGGHGSGLVRTLGTLDLTALGIAAIIGAGIFSTVGTAAFNGGPAVALLFVFTAVACGFSAMCYAEFASMIPVSGSAYTYAYAAFGELVAWIIGWDLLMEYAIGNIAVAISWSDYFTKLVNSTGFLHIPEYFTMDFLSASRGFDAVNKLLAEGQTLQSIAQKPELSNIYDGYLAWTTAPQMGGFHLVCDLPALMITIIITTLVFIGIRESKNASNAMVALKVAIVLFVIILGAFYVKTENWHPFAPNGVSGVLKGISAVFFAYIGFDAVSTTAEECRNPQRDLPRGMIYSLIICTVLYVLISLVLTGMTSYKNLMVGDPMAFVFGPQGANLIWVERIVAVSAVIAIATVLLVFQLGQPRIWMSMSRDGLLPPIFSSIHPRFKTPWFSTIVAGFVVATPSLFLNLTEVTDLTSIGTLFAFVLVSLGILVLEKDKSFERKFRAPYVNSKFIAPVLFLLIMGGLAAYDSGSFFKEIAAAISGGWDLFKHKIPIIVYLFVAFGTVCMCFLRNLSLIPVLGFLSCGYLMTELGITNWTRFLIWLVIGLVLYFLYGSSHSKLGKK